MTKFNRTKGTGNYFPIKQFRFETSKHPILRVESKPNNRLKALISSSEQKMVEALTRTLQCDTSKAIRIALYEAAQQPVEALLSTREYSAPDTKHRAHSGRKKTLSVQLPKEEKQMALELAKKLGISEKEIVRLAFVWLQRGIRDESITRLTKSPRIGQEKLAKEWSKQEYDGQGSKLKALRTARQSAYDRAKEHGKEIYNKVGDQLDRMIWESDGGFNPATSLHDKTRMDVVSQVMQGEEQYEFECFMQSISDETYEEQLDHLADYNLMCMPDLSDADARDVAEGILTERFNQDRTEPVMDWHHRQGPAQPIEFRHPLRRSQLPAEDDEEAWSLFTAKLVKEIQEENARNTPKPLPTMEELKERLRLERERNK